MEAVSKYGVWRGVWLGMRRLAALSSLSPGRLRPGSLKKFHQWPALRPNNPMQPGKPKKEMSMETRLLLAFLLMGLVLFLTPYVYKPAPPPAKPATGAAKPN